MANKNYQPGDNVEKDVKLYVKDSKGNTLGEINVPAGNRVPPTRIEGADHYSTQE
ncbi:MAG: hypothetical protein ACOYEC_06465 [Christensenellales bacterium]|jgi:hypothetical protein|nr:hypothetical protein [Clostridiales bacterium]